MAAEKSSAGKSAPESGPYTGPNPFDEGTPAWHGWNYLKKTVDADRRQGIDITKPKKPGT